MRFLRTDREFDPDSKQLFWYNAYNAFGVYCGLSVYAACADRRLIEFEPVWNGFAALYAGGMTFFLIVHTRGTMRAMLGRRSFKIFRAAVYWFCGFFTWCLFPLSWCIVTQMAQLAQSAEGGDDTQVGVAASTPTQDPTGDANAGWASSWGWGGL